MATPPTDAASFRVATFELEHAVDFGIDRVWTALVEEIATWWPRDFMVNPKGVAFRLEAKLGGVFGEDWGDGQGIVWATVSELHRPHAAGDDGGRRAKLSLSGELMPDYGGPARTQHGFILESADATSTRLRFQDCVYGAVSESTAVSLKEGWGLILDAFLKHLAR